MDAFSNAAESDRYSGMKAQSRYAGTAAQGLGSMQDGINKPRPVSVSDLVETASSALKRLHGIAASVDEIGDKLVGASPQSNEGEAIGGGGGSIGQLASLLSMIHVTVSRIERGTVRLHEIHG